MSSFQVLSQLRETVTQHGPVYRGAVVVGGHEFTVETDRETWCNVGDVDGVEALNIDGDGDILPKSGESVTANWTESDWREFGDFVGV